MPVEAENARVHDVPDDAEIEKFFPLVGFGSLGLLRSQFMNDPCSSPLLQQDLGFRVACEGLDGVPGDTFLTHDIEDRAHYSPAALQRRYCSMDVELTLEDALSRPPLFADSLFDTLTNPDASNSAEGINSLVVLPEQRGEENIEEIYKTRSLRSLVYVTSSDDPQYPPGVYRLLDLALFDKRKCFHIPGAVCTATGAPHVPVQLDGAFFDQGSGDRETGRQMISRVRCRDEVEAAVGRSCEIAPFIGTASSLTCDEAVCAPCEAGSLQLGSNPQLYSAQHWLPLLFNPPPGQPPISPSPPPPSPAPPPTPPPPLPPQLIDQGELMQMIRTFEDEACATVFFRSTAERCDLLATQLTQKFAVSYYPPPSPPPAFPVEAAPPPPTPPPAPSLPSALTAAPVAGVTLPTVRMPFDYGGDSTPELAADGYVFANGESFDPAAYHALPLDQRATCTAALQAAAPGALPCVSAALPERCVDYSAHCGSLERNTQGPVLELRLDGRPRDRQAYPWAVRVTLPQTPELAQLFFRASGGGASGFEARLLDGNGKRIALDPNVPSPESALPEDRELLLLLVSPTADADEVARLSHALYVQVRLPGALRQIWVRRVEVLERAFSAYGSLANQPPSSPPLPLLPPAAAEGGSSACTFYANQFATDTEVEHEVEHGCDRTQEHCCWEAQQLPDQFAPKGLSRAYLLSDAGCCTSLYLSDTSLAAVSSRTGFQTARAGTGLVP